MAVRQLEARPRRGREPVRAHRRARGQRARARALIARGVRGRRPQMARRRRDPEVGLPARATSTARTTPSGVFEVDDIETRESPLLHQRARAARAEEAVGLPGVRQAVHARTRRSARRWCPPRAPAPRTTSTAAPEPTAEARMRDAILRKARESARARSSPSSRRTPRAIEALRARARRALRAPAAACSCMGNGGSACDAAARRRRVPCTRSSRSGRALPAIALADRRRARSPPSATTPTSRSVFAEQLELLARAGRRRCSASRPRALGERRSARSRGARERGLLTIGFAGRDGGRMPTCASTASSCRAWSIHRIQETHTRALAPALGSGPRRAGRRRCPLSPPSCVRRLPAADREHERHPARPRQRREADARSSSSGLIVPGVRATRCSSALDDQAHRSPSTAARLAFTTDSFVVTPIFFPGGDIGELAVNGTVNDLAVGGATPALPLARVHPRGGPAARRPARGSSRPMRRAADARRRRRSSPATPRSSARGNGDSIFINTAGIGVVPGGRRLLGRARARPATRSSSPAPIGDHGIAILSRARGPRARRRARERHRAAHELVERVLDACPDVHAMRDPTRGGVAATLVEIATRAELGHRDRRARGPRARHRARRVRDARARSAVRRERRQARRVRPRGRRRARCSPRCARIRSARRRAHRARRRDASGHRRRAHRRSAASASSICRSARRCRESADQPRGGVAGARRRKSTSATVSATSSTRARPAPARAPAVAPGSFDAARRRRR